MVQTLKAPSILISMPQLQDPNFWRSVILMTHMDRDGAMGFILNRPSELPLAAVLKSEGVDVPKHVPTWIGGPVGTDHGLILTNEKIQQTSPEDIRLPGMMIGASAECLSKLIDYAETFAEDHYREMQERGENVPVLYPYRFLVGYAGWGAGQLEREIREGSWLHLGLDHELIFNTPWPKMWDAAVKGLGIEANEVAVAQPTPYLN